MCLCGMHWHSRLCSQHSPWQKQAWVAAGPRGMGDIWDRLNPTHILESCPAQRALLQIS